MDRGDAEWRIPGILFVSFPEEGSMRVEITQPRERMYDDHKHVVFTGWTENNVEARLQYDDTTPGVLVLRVDDGGRENCGFVAKAKSGRNWKWEWETFGGVIVADIW
jgi:hypothetical protein